VNDAFNWWLLIVGLVVGAGLVWVVLADTRRRELDVGERERASEARWIGDAMRTAGRRVDDVDALDILRLHEAYLAAPPPDDVDHEEDPDDRRTAAALTATDRRGVGPASVPETRPPMAHPFDATDVPAPARPGGGER